MHCDLLGQFIWDIRTNYFFACYLHLGAEKTLQQEKAGCCSLKMRQKWELKNK